MNKPGQLTAMISSTAVDLPEHRKEVVEGCLREGVFPIGMEQLPARDATGIKVSLEMVDKADIYIGIYAWRYGWVPELDNPEKFSVTEMEFNRALERKKRGELKEILIFVMDDDHPIRARDKEDGAEAQAKLKKFKERASSGRVRLSFKSALELRGHVIQSLAEAKRSVESCTSEGTRPPDFHPPNLIPKAPEPYIAHPYSLLQTKDVVGRQAELNLLTDWVTTNKVVPAGTRIFNLVAIGGMGKSALTWKWFNDIAPNELPKSAGRMWWSFYESDAHWENFIMRALAYAGGHKEAAVREMKTSEREEHLWRILDQQPYLIVLDGLERILLAYARLDASRLPDEDLDEQTGNSISATQNLLITDSSYKEKHRLRQCTDLHAGRLLKRFAHLRSSRILISSRLYPAELQSDVGQLLPGCFAKFLTGLLDDDALHLWREFGVSGSREQLLPIFRGFGNYPLLVRALAGEVADFRDAPGDLDRWLKHNVGFKPAQLSLKNARTHVLRFALRGLGEKERFVLSTLAAFRMPASWQTLQTLVTELHAENIVARHENAPAGSGGSNISEGQSSLPARIGRADLDSALADLEDRGLIGWDRTANRYDLHPIVRMVAWHRTPKAVQKYILDILHHYLATRSGNTPAVKNCIEDITADIELYCTLVGLGRYKDALSVFRQRLNETTLYVFGAIRLRVELLEMLFPNGTASAPSIGSEQERLLRWVAFAYYLLGEPGRALQMTINRRTSAHSAANMTSDDWKREFYYASSSGKLRLAAGALAKSATCQTHSSPKSALLSCLPWFLLFSALRGLKMPPSSERRLLDSLNEQELPRKVVLVWSIIAQRFLWDNDPHQALSAIQKVSGLVMKVERQREPIRIERLFGAAHLAIGNIEQASLHLQKALVGSRGVNLVEEELQTLTLLAELHRVRKENVTAREILEQIWNPAQRAPYPLFYADALNILTQIERDEGSYPAAVAAATHACRLAWCDGVSADGKVSYAYHYGLANARRHLQELGAPEPQLVPFDESEFDPLPEVNLNPSDEFWLRAGGHIDEDFYLGPLA